MVSLLSNTVAGIGSSSIQQLSQQYHESNSVYVQGLPLDITQEELGAQLIHAFIHPSIHVLLSTCEMFMTTWNGLVRYSILRIREDKEDQDLQRCSGATEGRLLDYIRQAGLHIRSSGASEEEAFNHPLPSPLPSNA